MSLFRRRRPPPVCEHLESLVADPMPEGGCIECIEMGSTWVHLRYCVTCGETRCCDSSVNQHARKHSRSSGHPVVRSKEPGEVWAWCYVHEQGTDLSAEP